MVSGKGTDKDGNNGGRRKSKNYSVERLS